VDRSGNAGQSLGPRRGVSSKAGGGGGLDLRAYGHAAVRGRGLAGTQIRGPGRGAGTTAALRAWWDARGRGADRARSPSGAAVPGAATTNKVADSVQPGRLAIAAKVFRRLRSRRLWWCRLWHGLRGRTGRGAVRSQTGVRTGIVGVAAGRARPGVAPGDRLVRFRARETRCRPGRVPTPARSARATGGRGRRRRSGSRLRSDGRAGGSTSRRDR
jgi:hypothetical protein